MILRYFVIISLILGASCPQTTRAEPSSCTERLHYTEWTQKYFHPADAVFFGEVVAEEMLYPPAQPAHPAQPTSDSANVSSMQELLDKIKAGRAPPAPHLQSATFRIQKSWIKLVGPKITVKSNLYFDDTGHHAPFSTGDTYLVFAYKSDDGTLRVPIGCASHEAAKDTASKIRVLDALTRKPGDP